MTKPINIIGMRGILMHTGHQPYIRIYSDDKETHKDYLILHNDLSVTITDCDAYLYVGESGLCDPAWDGVIDHGEDD